MSVGSDKGILCTEQHGRIKLRQLNVLKQHHSQNCGFHAIYNAMCYEKYLKTVPPEVGIGEVEVPEDMQKELKDAVAFWRFFWRLRGKLCEIEGLEPGIRNLGGLSEPDIDAAVTEACKGVQEQPVAALYHSAYQRIICGMSQREHIDKMKAFVKEVNDHPGVAQVCVMAVADHWVSYAVRVGTDADGERSVCVDLMESRNHPMFDQEKGWEACIREIVDEATVRLNLKRYQKTIYLIGLTDICKTFAPSAYEAHAVLFIH